MTAAAGGATRAQHASPRVLVEVMATGATIKRVSVEELEQAAPKAGDLWREQWPWAQLSRHHPTETMRPSGATTGWEERGVPPGETIELEEEEEEGRGSGAMEPRHRQQDYRHP